MATYVISDIHGFNEKFEQLLEKIQFEKSDKLFLLGDYIDRGPNSKLVIDRIIELKNNGFDVWCLRGNHEQMLLDASIGKNVNRWLNSGGIETLKSFGINQLCQLETKYLDFINSLSHFFEYENYIFVHAGINMRAAEPMKDFESMLWLRNWEKYFNRNWLKDRRIIHGHTPMSKNEITRRLNLGRVICVDNGVYLQAYAEYGNLFALNLDTMKFVFV